MTFTSRLFLLLFIIIQSCFSALSQTTISGILKDGQLNPVANVNILVFIHHTQSMIGYGFSNQQGKFQISLQSDADSLRIEVTSIQYRKELMVIPNISREVEITLTPDVKDLSEFVVRSAPIEKRGDTISYLVSSFAREQDRSISDVLKKMPGIEVEPSGRILYQGEPIQNLYVEGLDLMSGRYGLVSNNLPHRSVSSVQILENHQPIKILEERLPSYRSSLNITLKKDITTTGTARLGSGVLPLLWDANITPMTFTRNFQIAGSYQANNTGSDASKQLDALTSDNMLERMANNTSRTNLLSVPSLSPPGFNENRYLNNNIHLLNANALLKLNRDYQLRTNLHFIYDNQQQNGNTRRTMYTASETIIIDEHVQNRLQNKSLRGEITLSKNTRNNYLDNKLEFQSAWDQRRGNVILSSGNITQKLNNPFQSVTNALSLTKPLGERLITLNSFFHYDYNPQSLTVSPGNIDRLLQETSLSGGLSQETNMQRFFGNHNVSMSFGKGSWSIIPKFGIQHQQHNLISELDIINESERLPTPFRNQTTGIFSRTYLETGILYKKESSFSLSADLPFSYNYVDVRDRELDKKQTINRFFLSPRVTADYQINGFWRVRSSYSISHTIGDATGVYYSYILRNYRNIQINDSPLQQSLNHNYSLFLSHRNPLKSVFSSFSGMYSVRNNSLMYANNIQPDGSSILQAIKKPNTSRMMNLNGRSSKFVRDIRTTFSLQGVYSLNWHKQWVNDVIYDGRNFVYSFSPRANIEITEKITSELKGEWLHYDTWRNEEKVNNVDVYKYFLTLFYFPAKNQHLALYSEFYHYDEKMNYFFDLNYRYVITARKIDLEIKWVNILNQKSYIDYNIGYYSFIENQYLLRPMQLVASVKFNF